MRAPSLYKPDVFRGHPEPIPAEVRGASGWNVGGSHSFLWMVFKKAREWLTHTGVLASRPAAFVVFAVYGLAWIALGDGLKWHSIATLATWGMTLVIQRAEHRDTQAIHAKLDELLKADGAANNKVMRIDDKDAEEVETARREVRAS